MLMKYLYIFLISMVPIIELRVAVPIGIAMGLPWHYTLIVSIIGNCIPVPFIIFMIRWVLMKMHGISKLEKIAAWIDAKAEKNKEKINKYGIFGLYVFVAIPLPGTGAWTGALVAAVTYMDKKKAFISIGAGVITAGLIMTLGSKLVELIVGLF